MVYYLNCSGVLPKRGIIEWRCTFFNTTRVKYKVCKEGDLVCLQGIYPIACHLRWYNCSGVLPKRGIQSWYFPLSKWLGVYFPASYGLYIFAICKHFIVFFPRDTFFIVKDTEGERHQKLTDLIQVGIEKKLISFSPFWWFIQASKNNTYTIMMIWCSLKLRRDLPHFDHLFSDVDDLSYYWTEFLGTLHLQLEGERNLTILCSGPP